MEYEIAESITPGRWSVDEGHNDTLRPLLRAKRDLCRQRSALFIPESEECREQSE